jgi:hypothetical protein
MSPLPNRADLFHRGVAGIAPLKVDDTTVLHHDTHSSADLAFLSTRFVRFFC